MKRPTHVWCVFAVGLLVAIAGMAWLSVRVTELERTEALRNHEADFESRVRLGLRRMDSFISQMLADQSAWPYVAYEPSFTLPASGEEVPSPLRVSSSPLVKLYFQVTPDMMYTSPGVPMRGSKQGAAMEGLSAEQVAANTQLLSQLRRSVEPGALLVSCAVPKQLTAASIAALGAPPLQSPVALNNSEAPPLNPAPSAPQQQVAQQAPAQGAQSAKQRIRSEQDYATRKNRYQIQAGNLNAQTQLRDQLSYGKVPVEEPLAKPSGGVGAGAATSSAVVEGLARPLWLGEELLLARRVNVGEQAIVQGCWFDWNAVKQALRREVADLDLGEFDVVPVSDESLADPSRLLATLSAQLVATVPMLPPSAAKMTPVRLALFAAWCALAAAALAAAILLRGVMALSERRAAFVSAVTHELRTPLTTFRMYSEMLAEGMVPDETQRRHYLGTLKTEADRLFHLIENVLSYARLERGRRTAARSEARADEMLAPIFCRLTQRAARDDMQVVCEIDPDAADMSICTDAAAVEQILVNLIDNACKYAAAATDRRIHVNVRRQSTSLEISVGDHGAGITASEARRLFRPFTKSANQAAQTAPGVGLGLALSQRLARDLGGSLELTSAANSGAKFKLILPPS